MEIKGNFDKIQEAIKGNIDIEWMVTMVLIIIVTRIQLVTKIKGNLDESQQEIKGNVGIELKVTIMGVKR